MDRADDREQTLIASIAHSPIATVITDPRLPDNPIVAVNEAFERLTGYRGSECIGRNCRFLAGKDTEAPAKAALREAVAQGRATIAELLNYRKDGSSFRNAVMIAPVQDEKGDTVLFLGSQMDVTGEKQLPQDLRRHRAADLVASLTRRQREVLEHMIRGLRNKQTAAFLGIDEKTVKMHRAALLRKLGVPTSADAIRVGVEAGIG